MAGTHPGGSDCNDSPIKIHHVREFVPCRHSHIQFSLYLRMKLEIGGNYSYRLHTIYKRTLGGNNALSKFYRGALHATRQVDILNHFSSSIRVLRNLRFTLLLCIPQRDRIILCIDSTICLTPSVWMSPTLWALRQWMICCCRKLWQARVYWGQQIQYVYVPALSRINVHCSRLHTIPSGNCACYFYSHGYVCKCVHTFAG
jgi:hypothetical protein